MGFIMGFITIGKEGVRQMKKKVICAMLALTMITGTGCVSTPEPVRETEIVTVEREMTVDDVVSVAGTDYFIVKEIDTWALLEEDVYMDRPVTEINICDDTEDTLCIFIDLADDEEPRIKQW
jgi:hypothetical protein